MIISRVADHCLWFGRYLDRAESTSRLLQVTRSLVFDADLPVTQCWAPMVIVSGAFPAFVERHGAEAVGNGEAVQEYMTWGAENMVSLVNSVRAARESARAIREVISLEAWEEVNEIYLWLTSDDAKRCYREDRDQVYRRARKATQLVLGLVRSTMLHDTPMRFLWLGAMLERVGQTARTLDMHHHVMEREGEAAAGQHQIVEVALWLSLLRACSGYEAFMKKAQGRINAHGVVAFLVFDAQFPRSLRYCLRSALRILEEIWPPSANRPDLAISESCHGRLERLSSWLDAQEAGFAPGRIHGLLTHIVDELAACSSLIGKEIAGPRRTDKQSQSVALAPGQ
jgi:uncharacterized alpha-E superfamily protein